MIALLADSLKDAAGLLFSHDTFDRFQVLEAVIVSYITFHMDGHTNAAFFEGQEEGTYPAYCTWARLRPVCFAIIKGKEMPVSFRISLIAGDGVSGTLFPDREEGAAAAGRPTLSFLYKEHRLQLITGVLPAPGAASDFDALRRQKELAARFDQVLPQWLDAQGLSCRPL